MRTLPIFALTVPLVLLMGSVVAGSEVRLLHDLLSGYPGPDPRPVNGTEAVTVTAGLSLLQLQEMNQEEQTLTITVFFKNYWTDEFLQWDPAEYDGIDRVGMIQDHVWKPDLELFNAYEKTQDLLFEKARIVAMNDGNIYHVPYLKLKSSCPCDPDADEVTCKLKFGSWVYHMGLVNLKSEATSIDTATYEQNRVWELLRTTSKVNAKEYPCCPGEKYGDITFSLTLKRRNKRVKQKVVSAAPKNGYFMGVILAAILFASSL